MDWVQIVTGTAVLLLAGGLAWLLRSVTDNSRKVDACASDEDMDNVRERVAALEATQKAMDVRSELGKVHERVDEVARTSANIDGQLNQVNRTLGLIQQHLMGGGE
ncbi:MAG: hypothetical protein F4X99_23255 [Gammaproteobacteria bacterium]|nr:hypothetical protein [Gammaproteobacteria bacterium]